MLYAVVGAMIAYLLTDAALGNGGGHFFFLKVPRLAAESRGSIDALMRSGPLRYPKEILSCQSLV
jgi:hypothetical protein